MGNFYFKISIMLSKYSVSEPLGVIGAALFSLQPL
jgi:hypothetical protein